MFIGGSPVNACNESVVVAIARVRLHLDFTHGVSSGDSL